MKHIVYKVTIENEQYKNKSSYLYKITFNNISKFPSPFLEVGFEAEIVFERLDVVVGEVEPDKATRQHGVIELGQPRKEKFELKRLLANLLRLVLTFSLTPSYVRHTCHGQWSRYLQDFLTFFYH